MTSSPSAVLLLHCGQIWLGHAAESKELLLDSCFPHSWGHDSLQPLHLHRHTSGHPRARASLTPQKAIYWLRDKADRSLSDLVLQNGIHLETDPPLKTGCTDPTVTSKAHTSRFWHDLCVWLNHWKYRQLGTFHYNHFHTNSYNVCCLNNWKLFTNIRMGSFILNS